VIWRTTSRLLIRGLQQRRGELLGDLPLLARGTRLSRQRAQHAHRTGDGVRPEPERSTAGVATTRTCDQRRAAVPAWRRSESARARGAGHLPNRAAWPASSRAGGQSGPPGRVGPRLIGKREQEVRLAPVVLVDDINVSRFRNLDLERQLVAGCDAIARTKPGFTRVGEPIQTASMVLGRCAPGRKAAASMRRVALA